MKILLAYGSLYSVVGGGQTMARNIIAANPQHTFYYFGEEDARAPANTKAIRVAYRYRNLEGGIDLSGVHCPRPVLSVAEKYYDIATMLDMAEAVADAGIHLDVVELPDFEPLIGLLPCFLRLYGIRVDRVVLAMHGSLTSSIAHLWSGPNPEDLSVLYAYEQLSYRAADNRYGISDAYLQKLALTHEIAGYTVDPLLAVDLETISWGKAYTPELRRLGLMRPTPSVGPAMNFVGRQDYIKGPDLFLYLVSNLPGNAYSSVNLFGSEGCGGEVSSRTVLGRIADLHGIKISENRQLPAAELRHIYASGCGITFTTSRVDTFNLAALESLLNGSPTVISSQCGICDYLDKTWPGLPYVKVDTDDIWPALPNLLEVANRYDYWRQRIADRLSEGPHAPRPESATLYEWPPSFDSTARDELALIADGVLKTVEAHARTRHLGYDQDDVARVARSHAYGHSTTDLSDRIRDSLYGADIIRRWRLEPGNGPLEPSRIDDTVRVLTDVAQNRRAERIHSFDLLAQAELARGNDLLYAVYQTRKFRLSGRADCAELDHTIDLLNANNLAEDGNALRLLYRGSVNEVYEYLSAQPSRCIAPSSAGIEFVEHFNRRDNPRVAVLVSVYNAEGKVSQFIQGLRCFIAETLQSLEVIFIDSGSPDQSSEALRRELSRAVPPERRLDATLLRTSTRETIQAAWNRALTVVRAPYITFLGMDEMMRPDALMILADILDRRNDIDWAQGSGVVCEVNERGTPIRDVMLYDRQMPNSFMHYLDCCYLGWVGGLYRRRVHDQIGFFNPRFRAAGDNEFKNRALPHMGVMSVQKVLGTFRNFPEERTTQSPIAEIEDLRAWHLPRSIGGMRYAFEGRDPDEAIALFMTCLNYRKSYMNMACTDLELGRTVADYLQLYQPAHFRKIQNLIPPIIKASNAYRQLDGMIGLPGTPVMTMANIGTLAASMTLQIAQAEHDIHNAEPRCSLGLVNDNRYHQYQNVWHSVPRRFSLDAPLSPADMAGPQDLAELLSSCQSDDPTVDFELAWANDERGQLERLFLEDSLDLVVAGTRVVGTEATRSVAAKLAPHLSGPDSLSLLFAGPVANGIVQRGRRHYVLGETATVRPVLAAARLIALPYWNATDADASLSLAVTLLALGKPFLVSSVIYRRLLTVFDSLPSAVEAGHLLVCSKLEDLVDQVRVFLSRSPDELASLATAAWRFAWKLHAGHPAISPSPSQRVPPIAQKPSFVLPLQWGSLTANVNRALHDLIEREDNISLQKILEEAQHDPRNLATCRAIIEALFVNRRAPILATRQPTFQKIKMIPQGVIDDIIAQTSPVERKLRRKVGKGGSTMIAA